MKRILLLTVATALGIALISDSAFAGSELKFFGVATDGDMLKLDVFVSNLGLRLSLNDHQRVQMRDVLADCHDRVVVARRANYSSRDYDRFCRTRYNDVDRHFFAILTPAQLREYRRWRNDVHRWVHEQRDFHEDQRQARRHEANEIRHAERNDEHRDHMEEHHDRQHGR